MSKMAAAGLDRSIYFMRDQMERMERMLKRIDQTVEEMKLEHNEIYKYTVVPNEATSVSSVIEQVRDHDYESAENKRLRGKTEW